MLPYSCYDATGDVSQPLWKALRAAVEPQSLEELHRASRAHPAAIRARLNRWRRSGLVEASEPLPPRYEIAPRAADLETAPYPGCEGPRRGTPLADDVWRALRRLGRPATFQEIQAASGAADRPLYCRLWRWVGQGFVRKHKAEPRRFALAASAPDVAVPPIVNEAFEIKAPAVPSSRERMWKAMRVLKSFDIPMLMITAEVTRRACDDFLNHLHRAGYVACRHRFRPNGGNGGVARDWSTYVLIRNTGPRHPTFTGFTPEKPQILIDRNTGDRVELAPRVPRQASNGR